MSVLIILVIVETSVLLNEWIINKQLELTDDSLEVFEGEAYSTERGDWISDSLAQYSLKKFKKRRGIFYNVKTRAYGHFFGLEKVKAFIKGMDKINDSNTDSDQKIIGFRVYRSRNEYSRTDDKYDDVFLIPVKANKKNLYEVDPDLETKNGYFDRIDWENFKFDGDSSLILNTSAPCPNNCVD
jgi:hypothetical protein